jgi:hypothetical protein
MLGMSLNSTFVKQLYKLNYISSPVMALYYSNSSSVGHVTFGDYDRTLIASDIEYSYSVSSTQWAKTITSVKFGSSSFKISSTSAIIDSATQLIGVPSNDLA